MNALELNSLKRDEQSLRCRFYQVLNGKYCATNQSVFHLDPKVRGEIEMFGGEGVWGHHMASAGARAYNGGLGAVPPAGVQGAEPPVEAF